MTEGRRDIPLFVQLLGLVTVVAIVAFVWLADPLQWLVTDAAPSPGQTEDREAPLTVITDSVRFESDAAVVEAVGTGNALRAILVHPEAPGEVTEILFESGQRVSRGDVLIRLDDREERLAIELARIRVEDARQTLRRYESVAPSGAVSASEVDSARTALSAARVELSQAELALDHRSVVAPFDGVMGLPEVDPGERISETTAIASLDDRSSILIDFELPEIFAPGVSIGDEVTAQTWALPDQAFRGRVAALGSRIDPVSRTLRVRVRVPNDDDLLRTGMSFNVRIALQGRRYPSVPSIAVQWNRAGSFVWRVRDGSVEQVAVRVLKRSESWVLVDAPLEAGQSVVVEGVQRLRPGASVKARDVETDASDQRSDAS